MDVEELLWAGADAQAAALRAGDVSAPDLLEAVLKRLDEVNETLNAFRVVWADEARAQAVDAQRRLDAGERTPLLGVPIAVKDDQDVKGDVTGMGGRPQFPPAEIGRAHVELQSRVDLVCRLLLEKKKKHNFYNIYKIKNKKIIKKYINLNLYYYQFL